MIKKTLVILLVLSLFLFSFCGVLPALEIFDKVPGGIGLSVLQLYDHQNNCHTGPIVIIDVLPKGSAAKANIERGDIITYIDDVPTSGKEFEYILEYMLRGPAYTSVTITIERASLNKKFNVTLDRVESKGLY